MTTRFVFNPYSAEFPSSNFPQLMLINRRPVLAYDASTAELCYWTTVAPQGITGTWTAVISFIMASDNNTSHTVDFGVAVEAITSGDAVDLDSSTSFDTENSSNTTIPGTVGYMKQLSITLTNMDSVAAADYLRFYLERNTAGTDDATGDCYILAVEIRDGA